MRGDRRLGVLDHLVTLGSGEVVPVYMRVIPNADGSEVLFTLFRLPSMSADVFERDAESVTRDLQRLKAILERDG